MKTMKKIVALMAVALLLCSMLPMAVFAANVADFDSISKTNTSYTTVTTTNGWTATYAAVFSGGSSNSSPNSALSILLNLLKRFA